MAIIDLTAEFKDATKRWTIGGQGLLDQFQQGTQDTRMGLYGSLYRNASTGEVIDANAKKDAHGQRHGKTIIKASGRTLKSGKFETEDGVIGRHKENHDHLHRRGDLARVCRDCLVCFLVLDLTGRLAGDDSKDGLKRQVRRCETHWNRGVRAYLSANQWNDPDQKGHSESRFLRDREHPTPDELSVLLNRLETELVGFGWIRR